LRDPIPSAPAYFGGIRLRRWTWSCTIGPATLVLPRCPARSRNTGPRNPRILPYSAFFRPFGRKTPGYVPSHCAWLRLADDAVVRQCAPCGPPSPQRADDNIIVHSTPIFAGPNRLTFLPMYCSISQGLWLVCLPFCEGISRSRSRNTPRLFRGTVTHMQSGLRGRYSGLASAHPTVALHAGLCKNSAPWPGKTEKMPHTAESLRCRIAFIVTSS
jgi:hypothetical protein